MSAAEDRGDEAGWVQEMANYWYWYWNRHLYAVVLPALKKLYEFQEHQVVPAMELLRADEVPIAVEAPCHEALARPYADATAVIERLREDTAVEQFGLVSALAVYTTATCKAFYLEASKFLLLLHRKEVLSIAEEAGSVLPSLGDLPALFTTHGIDLRQLKGFEAYHLLQLIAHYHERIPGDAGEELRRKQPSWVNPSPLGLGVARIEPSEVKWLYEDLGKFLREVVEALHQSL